MGARTPASYQRGLDGTTVPVFPFGFGFAFDFIPNGCSCSWALATPGHEGCTLLPNDGRWRLKVWHRACKVHGGIVPKEVSPTGGQA